MNPSLKSVQEELQANSDKKTLESGKRFFKEEVRLHGVKTATTLKIAKKYYDKALSKSEIFRLCEELLQTGYVEESFIACNWSYNKRREFTPQDFKTLEYWIKKYVSNWATCDTLCNHTIAAFVEMYPEYVTELKTWAKSSNRWMRRASAVTLILPARKGLFLKDIFEISDILLLDKEDLVQKGYGWMLKAASQSHTKEVYTYLMKHQKEMPRTAYRYALEKMPEEMRRRAMGN